MSTTTETQREDAPAAKRNPAPLILLVVVVLLVVYYAVVVALGAFSSSAKVPIEGAHKPSTSSYLTLRMKTEDIDLTNRFISATVLPVPHGKLEGKKAGEVAANLRIEIVSGGKTTSVVTFPGQSVIDPTAVQFTLERGDTFFPFDQPAANFQVMVQNDKTGKPVPFNIDFENSARPWTLSGVQSGVAASTDGVTVALDGSRDALTISLVIFYLLAILITTLMAVVIIGSALLTHTLEFANVIWLSATLISFPALRSAMPGAPPVGTALDFIVFFPCICLIAGLLVWTGIYLLWRESAILRRRRIGQEEDEAMAEDDELNSANA